MTDELKVEDEFYFQWHITEKCNRACKHCYQNGRPFSELPLSELLVILERMKEALVKWDKKGTVSLTGGEPFIRRDELYELMTHIDHSESIAYYDILTNGSLISETEAVRLKKQKKLRRVQVSLEGATAKSNDAIRGPGSFDSTITAIRHLHTNGIEVSVMITVTKANQEEIPAVVELAGREGVSALSVERFIPEGRGAELSDQVLSPDELHRLYEKVHKLAVNSPPVRILLYRPLFAMLSSEDHTVGALCSAGNNSLTIMPDGTIYPCRRLPISIGNVLVDGFFKIWYGSDVLWRIRNPKNLQDKCRDCPVLSRCRGCRAMAYFTSGDFMAEDPQCWR